LTWFDQPEVLAAIVTFIASILVAIITAKLTLKNDERIKNLEDKLIKQQDENKARLDYDYEARKRLYREFEPLLFLFVEYSESAYYRIYELVRTAKNGNLEPDKGWLSETGYFTISTIYRLLLPLVIYRLIQVKLTSFDLDLEPIYKLHYLLAKRIYFSFADDYNLASYEPKIDYDGDYEDEDELNYDLISSNPIKYKKQGLYRGYIDKIADLLIEFHPEQTKILSFGEFEEKYFREKKNIQHPLDIVLKLFINFHPKTNPVLWRILITQAHLYIASKNIQKTRKSKSSDDLKINEQTLKLDKNFFDWRKTSKESTDEEVLINHFIAAQQYLKDYLPYLKLSDIYK
jgi:hypothetical protein